MRLFIAIRLSPPVLTALAEVQEELGSRGAKGRFVRREDLHLTLAFLGETDRVGDARTAMAEVCGGGPFPLTLSGCGRFGDLLWAGAADSRPLTDLAAQLCSALLRRDFVLEDRDFVPHITLCRRYQGPDPAIPRRTMTVTHISLMRSDRGRAGAVYTELFRCKL